MVTYSWERSEKNTSVSAPSPGQRDLVFDFLALQRLLQRGFVVVDRGAGRAHVDALERDVHRQRRRPRQGRADGLDDPAPVGVAAVQRGLHERRVGDRARDRLDALDVTAAHDHARDPRGALAVGDHHDRELAQQRVERLAEAQLVLALRRDPHAGGAGAHQHRDVVRRELAVDRGAVERALDA